jgi:ribonucleotide reductase alpha subunit
MANKEFTPAGRTITNAGAPTPVVANCIVLPIKDSMEGIFQTLKDAASCRKQARVWVFRLHIFVQPAR